MNEPRFLSVEEVLDIHREAIALHGGTLGIRDPAALESAIFHPQSVYHYNSGDPYDIAAAYAFHIAEAQAFIDGNKRAAVGAALVFLELNGVSTDTDSMLLYPVMIDIAAHKAGKPELTAAMRSLFRQR